MHQQTFITNSFIETQKLGEKIISEFRGSTPKKALVLALYGDLGSGKTTFVQGLAEGLGIKRRIISPTFIIVRQYRMKNHELRIMNFYHVDLYRMENLMDVKELELKEILDNPNNIIAIEWAEKLGNGLPKKRWDIKFEYLDENKRKITIINYE
ncbi:MAG: tRNA (adenosine(37)-N6)-threonylcarbamoyltransferase complex ATPase subunit type 1 TsaE [Patescibacteria group bacterium]